MGLYTKIVNYLAKDSLPSGNAGKIVKGAEIDAEFTAVQTAINSAATCQAGASDPGSTAGAYSLWADTANNLLKQRNPSNSEWNPLFSLDQASFTLPTNLTFQGSSARIIGDFSNATFANRVLFQSSVTNGNTSVGALPNGTSVIAGFSAITGTTANESYITTQIRGASDARIDSGIIGSGTYLPMTFYTGGAERMRIDTAGNVGIGVSPTSKLHVSGDITVAGQVFKTTASGSGYLAYGSNGATNNGIYYDQAGSALAFYTVSTERVRVDSSGNLLVGTTSAVGKLTINSNLTTGRCLHLSGTTAGDTGFLAMSITKFDNNSTTSQIFQQFLINNGSTGSGQINANGASACAFGTFSDRRLKENITDLPSQLDNIMALRPVEFDYRDGSGHQIGFIAQEVQPIYPDTIGEGENGMLTLTGWSKTDSRLVKAIQELKAIIDAQALRIAALEAK